MWTNFKLYNLRIYFSSCFVILSFASFSFFFNSSLSFRFLRKERAYSYTVQLWLKPTKVNPKASKLFQPTLISGKQLFGILTLVSAKAPQLNNFCCVKFIIQFRGSLNTYIFYGNNSCTYIRNFNLEPGYLFVTVVLPFAILLLWICLVSNVRRFSGNLLIKFHFKSYFNVSKSDWRVSFQVKNSEFLWGCKSGTFAWAIYRCIENVERYLNNVNYSVTT